MQHYVCDTVKQASRRMKWKRMWEILVFLGSNIEGIVAYILVICLIVMCMHECFLLM